jgi:hypothetical protein
MIFIYAKNVREKDKKNNNILLNYNIQVIWICALDISNNKAA